MKELTSQQLDALTEVCNVGVSRAARQLSNLTKSEIGITVPLVQISLLSEARPLFNLPQEIKIPCIYTFMHGALDGTTFLIFSDNESQTFLKMLVDLMPSQIKSGTVEDNKDILIELGNIIISSSLGTMGDMLGQEILIEVPEYKEDNLGNLLNLYVEEPMNKNRLAVLVIKATMHVSDHDIQADLLLVFKLGSLKQLVIKLDEMIENPPASSL